MFQAAHVIAHAHGSSRLVHDDRDTFDLLRRVVHAYGARLLGYCIMPNHLHVVAEGAVRASRADGVVVMRAHARAFNNKHRASGELVCRDVEALAISGSQELATVLRYVHENPVKPAVPLAPSAIAFEWSSARTYAGLARLSPVNIRRAYELMGDDDRRLRLSGPELADLEPVLVPTASPDVLVTAAAQAWMVLPEDVVSEARSERVVAARCTYAALGRLESYIDRQLARTLGRARSTIQELVGRADPLSVQVARTLMRTPDLRARLIPVSASEPSPQPSEAAPSGTARRSTTSEVPRALLHRHGAPARGH